MDAKTTAGPLNAPVDHEKAKTRALSGLRQATWECSQFMHRNEIADYFAGVLNEIEADE